MMRRAWFRARAFALAEAGASMLELALVAPFLIFLAIGAVEVGTFMYDGIEVANAARAGVQYATQGSASSVGANYLNTAGIVAAAVADAKDVVLTKPTATSTTDVTTYYTCDSAPTVQYATPPTTTCTAVGDHIDTYVKVVAEGTFQSFLTFPGILNTITITRTAIGEVTP